jgi:hypothetical protein
MKKYLKSSILTFGKMLELENGWWNIMDIIALSIKMADETLWTSSSAQIWSKMSFNMQAWLKGRGVCWWLNLASLKKLDYLIFYSGTSGFGSFRVKPRKELRLKI